MTAKKSILREELASALLEELALLAEKFEHNPKTTGKNASVYVSGLIRSLSASKKFDRLTFSLSEVEEALKPYVNSGMVSVHTSSDTNINLVKTAYRINLDYEEK